MTRIASAQADLFEASAPPLSGFWASETARHVVAMATTKEPRRALFSHSLVNLFGLDLMMHIGPGGCRGIAVEDWQKLLAHLSGVGSESNDLAVFCFCALEPRP